MAPTVPGEAGCSPPAKFLLDLSVSELFWFIACWSGDFAFVEPVLHGAASAEPAVKASAAAATRPMSFIAYSSEDYEMKPKIRSRRNGSIRLLGARPRPGERRILLGPACDLRSSGFGGAACVVDQ